MKVPAPIERPPRRRDRLPQGFPGGRTSVSAKYLFALSREHSATQLDTARARASHLTNLARPRDPTQRAPEP